MKTIVVSIGRLNLKEMYLLSVTQMNLILLAHFVLKSPNKVQEDSFVSFVCSVHPSIDFCLCITNLSIFLMIAYLISFLGDGRWRQVIRRCASVSDTGVTGVCNWGVLPNGVYWEECYCSHDGCNTASSKLLSLPLLLLTFFVIYRQ